MKAIVKTAPAPGHLEYTDFPEPGLGPDDVLIEVRAAGICGTDVSLYSWADSLVREYRPEPPLVMGHEFAGVVHEVGARVTRFRAGDQVTANPVMSCGRCYFCRAGRQSICDDRPMLGVRLNGCFARFVAVREENVFAVPPYVSPDIAAMTELLCVALHALERVPVVAGDTVAVVGPGPLGVTMLLAAHAAGAAQVIVTGCAVDRQRLQIAESLGARAIVVDEEDPVAVVMSLTRGLGADVVFECAGHASAVPQALSLVRKGGRIGVLGQGYADSSFNTALLSYREVELLGVRAYGSNVWHRSYEVLASGRIPLEALVTHRLALAEVEHGIELMRARQGLKILFTPAWA